MRVARRFEVNLGDVEPVRDPDGLRVDFAAAGDEDLRRPDAVASTSAEGRFVRECDAGMRPASIPGDDDGSRGPGSGAPIDSKVLRPMISGLPIVSALKRLRSLDSRQGSALSAPIAPLRATAAMSETMGALTPPPAP